MQVTTLELYVDCDIVLVHFTIHLTEALYTVKKRKKNESYASIHAVHSILIHIVHQNAH